MKLLPVLAASTALGLTACGSFNSPINSSGFDPLLTPGAGARPTASQPTFKAGDLVRAAIENTFFFKELPKGGGDADKTLIRGTGMKVIRVAGSYLQVELDVTGEVGYVPSIMVENASLQNPTPDLQPGQYQVYPPSPGDPNLPPADPTLQPPDGIIPAIIDPSLPATPAAPTIPDPSLPSTPPAPPTQRTSPAPAPASATPPAETATPPATAEPEPQSPVEPATETPKPE